MNPKIKSDEETKLLVEIPAELKRNFKVVAAKKGKSMKELLIELMESEIKDNL